MSTNPPAKRRRGDVARSEAIEVARALLLADGPSAVTLKAVGQRLGMGHANLIHHFGSAAGLHGELMDRMVRDLAERITMALPVAEPATWDAGALVAVVFEAFGSGGAADLAAWMTLAREADKAESFAQVVRDLADRVAELAGGGPTAQAKARALVLVVTYMAFADGLIGSTLRPMLGADEALGPDLTVASIAAILAR
jgi:AcrR family transcriptional regulator